jgi:26S proteasome regulatory subunit N3
MDIDASSGLTSSSPVKTPTLPTLSEPSPEVDTYFCLLFILYLIDNKSLGSAIEIAHQTAEKIHTWNRRTLDSLASKIYFYLSRAHEIQGDASEIRPSVKALLFKNCIKN